MTLTNDHPTLLNEETVAIEPRAKVARPRAPLRRRVMVVSSIVVVCVLGAWLLFAAFEGPFANAWYSSRQRALAADFNAAHAHTGAGHAIATMQIPRLGVNVVVAEGDTPQQLRGGPGHRTETPLPGALGNSVIVGHDHDWGAPLSRLHDLHKGDLIAIQSYVGDGAETGVYKVASTTTVDANTVAPFATSNDFRVTLITGDGDRFSDRRFVVTAISGDAGRVRGVRPDTIAQTPAGSLWTNNGVLVAVVGLLGALIAYVVLRRRYRLSACLVVVVPLATLGLLGLLFDLDLLLPPLR